MSYCCPEQLITAGTRAPKPQSAITLCDQVALDPRRAVPNRPQIVSAVECSNSEGVDICDTTEVNTSAAETTDTDGHIAAQTAEIARLRAEAASPLAPEPIRQRLTQRAAALEQIAERHARTRVTTRSDDARG
jgi:hypothetical protein